MRSPAPTSLILFALSVQIIPSAGVAITLAVDANRDGQVDFVRDAEGKTEWTRERGAVFLNNCDADSGLKVPDHSDTIVNGETDLLDLAMIRMRRSDTMSAASTVTLGVDAGASSRVRVFLQNTGGIWVPVPLGTTGNIPTDRLVAGDLELRIEGNSFATGTWNGEVTVTASANLPGLGSSSDTVKMRVAPFLLLPNTQPAKEFYVRAYTGGNETFISQLQTHVPPTGATVRVGAAGGSYSSNDIWMQDAYEIGYQELPGRKPMSVVLPANRGSTWNLWRYAQDQLLAPDYGWFTSGTYRASFGNGSAPNGWLDWFGNLEVTPPYPGHPHGRVFYGISGAAGLNPEQVAMLNAQGMQGPALALDTGWLTIKHVDEMICPVPSGNAAKPWKILVPDTNVAYALLDTWSGQGHGGVAMLGTYTSGQTVDTVRSNATLRNYNTNLQSSRINPMIEVAKTAWGLTEAEVIRVPSIYKTTGESYMPNMVNSAVVNGLLLVSDPVGPRVGGNDLMQAALNVLINGMPVSARYLDDQRYHRWDGNTHCATNTRRAGFEPSIWSVGPSESSAWVNY